MARRWTNEEKNYVIDNWGSISIRRMAKAIDRTEKAIISFGEKNSLGGTMINTTYLTPSMCAEMINVDNTTIISWIKKKELKAKLQTLRKRKIYLIDTQDFKDFLKANQDRWCGAAFQNDIFNSDELWLQEKVHKDSKYSLKTGEWTVLEEKRLMKLYEEGVSVCDIASSLNRSVVSIKRKRDRLVQDQRVKSNKASAWSNSIKDTIIKNWGILSLSELSALTCKPEHSIQRFAYTNKLGSLYVLNSNTYSFKELSEILCVGRSTIDRWYKDFGLKVKEQNKGNKKRYVVDINDVEDFLDSIKDCISESKYIKYKSLLKKHISTTAKQIV